jgi:hypothetical protein
MSGIATIAADAALNAARHDERTNERPRWGSGMPAMGDESPEEIIA